MINQSAEQQFIGYIWAHPNNFADLSERKRSEFFSDPTCLAIWQAISKSFVNNSETNEITVRQYLSPNIDLSWVQDEAPDRPDVYVDIVRSNYLRREFAAVVARGAEQIKNPQTPPEFVVSDTGARILDLTMLDAERKPTDFKSVMHRGLAFIKKNYEAAQNQQLIGIDLISEELNSLTGGARKKEATYIAGRPGIGKTGYAMNIIVKKCLVIRRFRSRKTSFDVLLVADI